MKNIVLLNEWTRPVTLSVLLLSAATCFADSDNAPSPGTPFAWGNGFSGQLGDGIFHQTSPFGVNTALTVQSLGSVSALAGGISHSLALRPDGSVWEWGQYGHFLSLSSATPLRVSGITIAVAIEAGESHSMALLADGTVRAWGFGANGQIGNGTFGSFNAPVPVSGLGNVVRISGGAAHSLALKSDGMVWAWGANIQSSVLCGQLGDGTSVTSRNVPVQVGGATPLTGVVAISAGGFHSLALKSDGTVWAWGWAGWGQLGNGVVNNNPNLLPIQVPNLNGVVAIAAGWEHSLALKSDGTVWAFGRDAEGQIGNGIFVNTGNGSIPNPTQVLNLSNVERIAAGQYHSLALKTDHTVWGWGKGSSGELDSGHFYNTSENFGSSVPVRATSVSAAGAIAAGYNHTLAVRIDNSPPVARCANVSVVAGPNCTATASIDNGSSDPDPNDQIVLTQTPPGPYSVGTTQVILTVVDSHGESATCTATVTVTDNLAPSLNCPLPTTAQAGANCSATIPNVLNGVISSDCNGPVILTQSPAAGTSVGLGQHTITVTGTDHAGNQNSCVTTFTVVDAINPVVTLLGVSPLTVECHTPFSDPGATATDNCGGSLQVTVAGSVNANLPGTYTLTYSSNDASGNAGSATRTVNVVDTTPPVVTLNGAVTSTVECHTSFTDPGATANDLCAGSTAVTVTGSVDSNTPGTYTLTYSATDPSGNTSSAIRTVTVVDTTAPLVTLNGPAAMSIECHSGFSDPGASANDICAGSLPVVVTGSVDPNLPGTYTLTYAAADPSGNGSSTTRTVNVVDTTAPVITLNGSAVITVECHGTVTDPGATASDVCAGLTPVTVIGSVDSNSPGSYTLTYSAVDPSGNSSSTTRTVNVVDTTAPVITLNGSAAMAVECHSGFADPGASANDLCAGSATVTVTGSVNINLPRSYTLTYIAIDSAGNTASTTRSVDVVDTIAPVVTLNGSAVINIECHSSFTDPGATAADLCAGVLPVTVTGAFDVNTPGTYTLSYSAADPAGNVGIAMRTINVTDTIPPTVTLVGPAIMSVDCQSSFVDPGATAADSCAGPLAVVISGAVNQSIPGTYVLTYTAIDPSGNVGAATRTVTVGNTAPVLTAVTGPAGPLALGTSAQITINFIDELPQTHTAVFTWDDGSSQTAAIPANTASFVLTHTYSSAGVYTVGVTITDPCGLSATSSYQFVVIYNPNGGFVTGGGWINSPAGAYVANPALSGKATFGFNSKYARGATVPEGNTKFQFHVADFTFNSTSYEWLVVAGHKAQYKGTGTVNGASGYMFLLTATDGDISGGGGIDKFRIKITTSGGGLVYDNSPGSSDDIDSANPQAISGGSVVIHKE